ncbi:hypothetical protein ACQ4M3_38825 [Leptolyngbya sp. AN03gr2]|uniref:hypothetical protein n=1 Tax=unclassified Leptolyngbya TaxID=2650499 RepID=UPI003D317BB4
MLELRPNQILVRLSAAHLEECRQWQEQIETEWRQAQQQRQVSQAPDVPPLPIPRRGGAIGGAFTYTIRLTPHGYHLAVKDAISQSEREWTTSGVCSDWVVFAVLYEREYQLLVQEFDRIKGDSFEDWVQRLVYSFCDNTLGRVTRVLDLHTGTQLDLTDYEGW